ncbi:MAG TPA: HAD-IC family P-type ATPase [Dehalococcoidia bacterium]|nr:HAD-IC family P-type ATPase [Dehalococcoidia bacterium]
MTSDAPAPAYGAVRGLSAPQVAERVLRGQVNKAAARSGRTYRRIIYDNAFAPVSVVLYVISGMLVALGLVGDALMTAGLVLVNVVVGSVQESKAKRRLDEISLLVQPTATVIRDGIEASIAPDQIVLGDSVLVRQGDELQVDGIVLAEQGLSVDESLLTGESDYVPKGEGDRVHAGSYCTAGSGVYEADRVGADSLAQQITARARAFHLVQTPLQREVSVVILVMAVVVAVLGLSVFNALVRIYGGVPLEETVRAAAVIVALVPQGLAFMITVSYAKAAVRIASLGALVQRLNAIESLSHVDVLCIDKTGTLTTNELSLEALEVFDTGREQVELWLGRFAASASAKNRTATAIAAAFPAEPVAVRFEVPFDSERKWSALGLEDGALYVLGAPDVLERSLTEASELRQRLSSWLERGLRVLLFARLANVEKLETGPLPPGLQPLALIILRDQMRTEAAETVKRFASAGINLKVLSGDHPDAVASLAYQAGIDSSGRTIAGTQLDAMDQETLARTAREATVFGRITPEHKERLIGALRDAGHTVAMIGDGVNDIPAMKRASVSVAMRSGSPATRGVADAVLLNDSFGVLPAAFLEGQRIRAGMETVLRLFLVRTLALSLVILGTSLLTDAFPTTPRQAGIPAFLAVGIPSLVVVFTATPARTGVYLLRSSVSFILPATLSVAIACIALYHGYLEVTDDDVTSARTALAILQVACGLVVLPFARRPSQKPGLRQGDKGLTILAALLLVAGFGCLLIGPLRDLFEMEVLTPAGYAAVAGTVLAWAAVLHFSWRWFPETPTKPDRIGGLRAENTVSATKERPI